MQCFLLILHVCLRLFISIFASFHLNICVFSSQYFSYLHGRALLIIAKLFSKLLISFAAFLFSFKATLFSFKAPFFFTFPAKFGSTWREVVFQHLPRHIISSFDNKIDFALISEAVEQYDYAPSFIVLIEKKQTLD